MVRYFGTCCSYHDFLDRRLLLTRKLLNQWSLVEVITSKALQSPTWLTDTEYLCLKWYAPFVIITIRSFYHEWPIPGFDAIVVQQMQHAKQEMLPFQSTRVQPVIFSEVRVTRSLVHCIFICACPSSICSLLLPLWYLQAFHGLIELLAK